MKKILFPLLLTGCCLFVAAAGSSLDQFRFDQGKCEPGWMYHYVKSNIDGSNPEHLYFFHATDERLESFKYRPGPYKAGYVMARMDWTTFSAVHLQSRLLDPSGSVTFVAELKYDAGRQRARLDMPPYGVKGAEAGIRHLPFHVYSFDLMSLVVTFPHLIDPRQSFTIGLADPAVNGNQALLEYKGEATIRFIGEEDHSGTACLKYAVDGPGLSGQGGHLWLDEGDLHLVHLEIGHANNAQWQSFRLTLREKKRMNREEWVKLIEDSLEQNARE
jgi:hypothetical protein